MIIKKPIITEQSMQQARKGIYTFQVATEANKQQIRQGIERLYGVHVENIMTNTVHGKIRRAGKKRAAIKRPDWKKARVQLRSGEKISVFEVSTS